MIPMPDEPTVVVLLRNGVPVAASSNISPSLNVQYVNDESAFGKASQGRPYITYLDKTNDASLSERLVEKISG